MKVVVVLSLLLVPFCQGLVMLSPFEQAKKCVKVWAHVKQGEKTDMLEQCLRVKAEVDCVSQPTIGTNQALDELRFLTEQQVRFSNKFGLCHPKIDITKLGMILEKTGVKDKYRSIAIDDDLPVQCALDVYRKCVMEYDKLYVNGKMCLDATKQITCLRNEAEKMKCKAPMMMHLIEVYKGLGDFFMQLKKVMPDECEQL